MGREPPHERDPYESLSRPRCPESAVCGIAAPFGPISPTPGSVTHVFLTRPPLKRPKAPPLDLHVLSTPPAFVLSQDQTLHDSTADSGLPVLPFCVTDDIVFKDRVARFSSCGYVFSRTAKHILSRSDKQCKPIRQKNLIFRFRHLL